MNQGRDHNPSSDPARTPRRRRIVRAPGNGRGVRSGAKADVPGTTPARTFRAPAAPVREKTGEAGFTLRLTADNAAPDMRPPSANPTPITEPADPRWVLALRTAEQLQGTVLPPEARDRLTRLGKVMGLTPFDCALILAIVQDQARRGIAPANCPASGKDQLSLIPLPARHSFLAGLRDQPLQIACLVAGMIALQGLLIWMWLG